MPHKVELDAAREVEGIRRQEFCDCGVDASRGCGARTQRVLLHGRRPRVRRDAAAFYDPGDVGLAKKGDKVPEVAKRQCTVHISNDAACARHWDNSGAMV